MMLEENAQELALIAKETGTDVLEAIRLAGQATNRVAARNEGGSMSKILILLALALLTSCMFPVESVRTHCSIIDAETEQPVQATVHLGAQLICERCTEFEVEALTGVEITVEADGYKTWSTVVEPDMKCPKLEKKEDDSSLLPGSLALVLHRRPFRLGY